jgi:hypothetical protein
MEEKVRECKRLVSALRKYVLEADEKAGEPDFSFEWRLRDFVTARAFDLPLPPEAREHVDERRILVESALVLHLGEEGSRLFYELNQSYSEEILATRWAAYCRGFSDAVRIMAWALRGGKMFPNWQV